MLVGIWSQREFYVKMSIGEWEAVEQGEFNMNFGLKRKCNVKKIHHVTNLHAV